MRRSTSACRRCVRSRTRSSGLGAVAAVVAALAEPGASPAALVQVEAAARTMARGPCWPLPSWGTSPKSWRTTTRRFLVLGDYVGRFGWMDGAAAAARRQRRRRSTRQGEVAACGGQAVAVHCPQGSAHRTEMVSAVDGGGAAHSDLICVTGGNDFIGSWPVRFLLVRGYTVHTTVNNFDDEDF